MPGERHGFELSLEPGSTGLLVLDVQNRLAAALDPDAWARCEANLLLLLSAARVLRLPVLVTEQYPRGLGPTVPSLQAELDRLPAPALRLTTQYFDATKDPGFDTMLDDLLERGTDAGILRTLVVCGLESHLTVYQTVRGLVRGGFHVHVPGDATAARDPAQLEVARQLWVLAGAVPTSTETVLFDLLKSARDPGFAAVRDLIRESERPPRSPPPEPTEGAKE